VKEIVGWLRWFEKKKIVVVVVVVVAAVLHVLHKYDEEYQYFVE
jgi:hypothetical protein